MNRTTVNIIDPSGSYLFSVDLRVHYDWEGSLFVRLPGIGTNSGYRAFNPENHSAFVKEGEADAIWAKASRFPDTYRPGVLHRWLTNQEDN
jgi:hypothetical protein